MIQKKILFITDWPSQEDILEEKLFTNGIGGLFRSLLRQSSITEEDYFIESLSEVSFVEFDKTDPVQVKLLQRQLEKFNNKLNVLLESASVVVLLGEVVYKCFENGNFNAYRGSILLKENTPLLPTYHPRELYSRMYGRKNTKIDTITIMLADLMKARQVHLHGYTPPTEDFCLYPTYVQATRYLERLLTEKILIANDIETTGLGKNSRLVLWGLAENTERCMVIPFLEKNFHCPYSNSEMNHIKQLLNKLLQTGRMMWQNALFDLPFLHKEGFSVNYWNVEHDTMLLHHSINPELPHKLDFITSIYGKTPQWKQEFKNKSKSILEMDTTEARTYNARDCVVLHQVLPGMLQDLKESKNEYFYYNESLLLIPAVAEMTFHGIYIPPDRLQEWQKHLLKNLKASREKLYKTAQLPPEFNLNSTQHLEWFLFGTPLPRFEDLPLLEDYNTKTVYAYRCTKCNKKFWSLIEPTVDKKSIQPNISCPSCPSTEVISLGEVKTSTPRKVGTKLHQELLQLQKLAQIKPMYFSLYQGKKSNKTQQRVLNEEALDTYTKHLEKRLGVLGALKKELPKFTTEKQQILSTLDWLKLYREYSKWEKLRSTYSVIPVDENNTLHCSFKIHGTATGRLSSSGSKIGNTTVGMNAQNIPAKEHKLLGKCFYARPGGVFVSADYKNLEALCVAYTTKDEVFIKAVEGGFLHDMNTKALFGITEKHPLWKTARHAAKIFQFGFVQYGGSLSTIYQKVCLACPELNLNLKSFEDAAKRYFDNMPVFAQWRQQVQDQAEVERISVNGVGRVRHLFGGAEDAKRQALNNPGQSLAAHIINQATIRIAKAREIQPSKYLFKFSVQIHDDLRVEVVDKKVPLMNTLLLMKTEMEKPVSICGVERVFPVDLEVGPSWGELIPAQDYLKEHHDVH